MGSLGFFGGGSNARIVMCHFIYHMRVLREKGGSWEKLLTRLISFK